MTCRIVREQTDGSIPVPVDERGRFVLSLAVGELYFEHRRRAVGQLGNQRESYVGVREWLAEAQIPLIGALGDEARQLRQPRAARLGVPKPRQTGVEQASGWSRRHGNRRNRGRSRTLRAITMMPPADSAGPTPIRSPAAPTGRLPSAKPPNATML